MKFVLFVEGHTEKIGLPSFLKRWLDPPAFETRWRTGRPL